MAIRALPDLQQAGLQLDPVGSNVIISGAPELTGGL